MKPILFLLSVVSQAQVVTIPSSVANGGLPSGVIVMILAGTCPTGYTEATALSGKTIIGTLAANGDVGSTGGSDSFTPAGTNSAPTFSGNAGTIPAETVAWPVGVPAFTGSQVTTSAVSAGTPAGTNGTVSFTPAGTNSTASFTPAGTNGASATSGNCAATNIAAGTGSLNACKGTAPNLTVTAQTFTGTPGTVPAQTFTGSGGTVPAETFTGSPLGTHTHTDTAAGTVAWPAGVPTNSTASFTPAGTVAAPTFSGNAFDNRSAFVKAIFCTKT